MGEEGGGRLWIERKEGGGGGRCEVMDGKERLGWSTGMKGGDLSV